MNAAQGREVERIFTTHRENGHVSFEYDTLMYYTAAREPDR